MHSLGGRHIKRRYPFPDNAYVGFGLDGHELSERGAQLATPQDDQVSYFDLI